MVICPDCGYENIEGVDECASCQQSLTLLSRPQPATSLEKGLTKDPIAVLHPGTPVSVASDEPVGEVLNLMVARRIGCVLVVDDNKLVGIFSERDALLRLNTQAGQLRDRPVKEFMTETPGTLEMDDKIAFAVHKMAVGGYRHIPILTSGHPTGIISIRDILRYATEKLETADS
ncbi:MAG: CBS domain-containing protein [Planctomycetales bacterium]|nr:CBS domain-containing protein [Planctomycetales bacterium]NIM07821.1 CBS domain-containing protein [Planctomycetales bacterium]NIN07313.1 CBS domain-containing protein [Planctomycetales bacterium]NIN76416.1 CBS domain-containing protein [Planctomycetales bacterium]NIO33614.1 CBS domain-containing protein [Planctomycetales bacterium]